MYVVCKVDGVCLYTGAVVALASLLWHQRVWVAKSTRCANVSLTSIVLSVLNGEWLLLTCMAVSLVDKFERAFVLEKRPQWFGDAFSRRSILKGNVACNVCITKMKDWWVSNFWHFIRNYQKINSTAYVASGLDDIENIGETFSRVCIWRSHWM